MQKKIIALAVAGLVSGAAFAQTNVTLYGRADLGYVYSKSKDNKFHGIEQGNGIGSGGSRIGFMGEENLGGGLKAIFKFEWGTPADDNFDENATSGSDKNRILSARYSYVGLAGDFGQVTLGRNGTPSDLYMGATTPWGIIGLEPMNQFRGKLGPDAAGQASGIVDGTRWDNSIAYASPKFAGLDLMGIYSFGEKNTKASDAGKLGLGARYANGPVYVSAVYQRQAEDKNSATPILGSKGWALGGSYDFKVVKVYANYFRVKEDDSGEKDTTYSLGVGVPVSSAGTVVAEYARLKQGDESTKAYSVGYRHNLSKRTSLYTYVSHFNNDEGMNGGWQAKGVPGEKQTNFTAGISHYF
jgi:predicted porin